MSEQEKRGLSDSDLEGVAGGRLSSKDEKRIREIIKEELEKHGNPKKPYKPKLEPVCAYMAPRSPLTEEMKKAFEALQERKKEKGSDDNKNNI